MSAAILTETEATRHQRAALQGEVTTIAQAIFEQELRLSLPFLPNGQPRPTWDSLTDHDRARLMLFALAAYVTTRKLAQRRGPSSRDPEADAPFDRREPTRSAAP